MYLFQYTYLLNNNKKYARKNISEFVLDIFSKKIGFEILIKNGWF